MTFLGRILGFGGLLLGATLLSSGQAGAASSCSPSSLPTTCTVDATNYNPLSPGASAPFVTGQTFAAGSTYVLTVANPLNTTWQYDTSLAGVTVNGVGGNGSGLPSLGGLVGQVGGTSASATGAFSISTMGALAVNGTAYDGFGNSYNYTPGSGLTLAMHDTDSGNNAGTQTVTITQAPTVGGNVLANVNVFANTNSVGTELSTGLTLAAGNSYTIAVTDPNHLWDNNINRTDPSPDYWLSTANGLTGTQQIPAPLCGPTANAWGITCDGPGTPQYALENPNGFALGELVALIGGEYYAVGTGRTFSGLSGSLSLLYWDTGLGDNAGFMNVSVYLVTAPEPASLALIGTALVGLALVRRRRAG